MNMPRCSPGWRASSWCPRNLIIHTFRSFLFQVADAATNTISDGAQVPHYVNIAMGDMGENEDFWANVVRYGRYFVTVMLGTGYIMVKPLVELLKKPTTAIAVISFTIFTLWFVRFTVNAMLGLDDQVVLF